MSQMRRKVTAAYARYSSMGYLYLFHTVMSSEILSPCRWLVFQVSAARWLQCVMPSSRAALKPKPAACVELLTCQLLLCLTTGDGFTFMCV